MSNRINTRIKVSTLKNIEIFNPNDYLKKQKTKIGKAKIINFLNKNNDYNNKLDDEMKLSEKFIEDNIDIQKVQDLVKKLEDYLDIINKTIEESKVYNNIMQTYFLEKNETNEKLIVECNESDFIPEETSETINEDEFEKEQKRTEEVIELINKVFLETYAKS